MDPKSKQEIINELTGSSADGQERMIGYSPIAGEMVDGIRVIRYRTAMPQWDESDLKDVMEYGVEKLLPVDGAMHLAEITRVMRQLEGLINVRFEPVTADDATNIQIFIGEGDKFKNSGYYSFYKQAIVIQNDFDMFQYSFAHELGHALGLSHPEKQAAFAALREKIEQGEITEEQFKDLAGSAGGNSRNYSANGTVMAYGTGSIEGAESNFGPYDIMVLQRLYGAAGGMNSQTTLFHATEGSPSVLLSDNPVTVMVSDASFDAYDSLQLPTVSNVRGKGESLIFGGTRVGVETDIMNVLTAGNRTRPVRLEGNELSNILEGGKGADTLISKGPFDTLIGREGGDYFFISPGSQGTVINDFNPQEGDKLFFLENPDSVRIVDRDMSENGQTPNIHVYSADGQLSSSVFIDLPAEQIQLAIKEMGVVAEEIVVEPASASVALDPIGRGATNIPRNDVDDTLKR